MPACPKCGYVQKEMLECSRCGIVFSKYRRPRRSAELRKPEVEIPKAKPALMRRCYRVFRWTALGVLIAVAFLVLRRAPPPAVRVTPDARERASVKVEEFSRATRTGAPASLQFNEAELNGWLQSNMALESHPQAQEIARSVISGETTPGPVPTGNVSDIRMSLVDDGIRAWVMFEVQGVNMTLELEGRLSTQDGYIRLQPTRGRLGSLPLSQTLLDRAVHRLFESPENREKFKLPDRIADIRVRDGELTVTAR